MDVEVGAPIPGAGLGINGSTDWHAAVSQDWQMLEQAPAEVRADHNVICEAMRDSNGQALRFASDALRGDREFLLGAAQEMGPAVLEHASDELRADREFIMEVADYCNPGDVIWYVPEEIRAELLSDRVFMLEAVGQVGAEVLEHASAELRADKSFILAAAEHCVSKGEAVQFATDELRKEFYTDRDFMLQAIEEAGPGVLEDASEALRADRAFLVSAAERCSLAEVLPYACEELRAVLSASKPKAAPPRLPSPRLPMPPAGRLPSFRPPAPAADLHVKAASVPGRAFELPRPLQAAAPGRPLPPVGVPGQGLLPPGLRGFPLAGTGALPLTAPVVSTMPGLDLMPALHQVQAPQVPQVPQLSPAQSVQSVQSVQLPAVTVPLQQVPPVQPVQPVPPVQQVQAPAVVVLTEKKIGVQVRRGPDWVWENQDGGDGQLGITENHSEDGWVQVRWATGECGVYRVGLEGRYDLLEVLPTAPAAPVPAVPAGPGLPSVQVVAAAVLAGAPAAAAPVVAPAAAPAAAAQRPVPPWRRRVSSTESITPVEAATPTPAASAAPAPAATATTAVTVEAQAPAPAAATGPAVVAVAAEGAAPATAAAAAAAVAAVAAAAGVGAVEVAASAPEELSVIEVQAGQGSGAADPRKRGSPAVPPWQRNRRRKTDDGVVVETDPASDADAEAAAAAEALAEACAELLGEAPLDLPLSTEEVPEASVPAPTDAAMAPSGPAQPAPANQAPAQDAVPPTPEPSTPAAAAEAVPAAPAAAAPSEPAAPEAPSAAGVPAAVAEPAAKEAEKAVEAEEIRSPAEDALQAVRELGPDALEGVPADLRGDREFMLAVSRYCPLADVLRHFSDELHAELLADREFVLRAVEEIGVAVLGYANPKLRSDLGFMMEAAACSSAAEAMKYASKELRAELEGNDESDSEISL